MFIRINPDEENFNIFKEINKIHRHIKKSTKKQTKESTKNHWLMVFQKDSQNRIWIKPLNKIKVLKLDCQENTTHHIRHEKHIQ